MFFYLVACTKRVMKRVMKSGAIMYTYMISSTTGVSEILATVTFQMLWPLATTNYGGRRPRIASL